MEEVLGEAPAGKIISGQGFQRQGSRVERNMIIQVQLIQTIVIFVNVNSISLLQVKSFLILIVQVPNASALREQFGSEWSTLLPAREQDILYLNYFVSKPLV